MPDREIKKHIFISSIFINILIIALVVGSRDKIFNSRTVSDSEKTETVKSSLNPTVAGVAQEAYLVTRVIDGDTISLENGDTVRYIGIDTPENTREKECFGKEASNKNKEIVEGKLVRLEKDVSEKDRYGRLLRYVYIDDLFINDYLVREGFALASSYPPDIKYQQEFLQAQREAFEAGKGLWGVSCVLPSPPAGEVTLQGVCKYSCESPDRDCSEFSTQAEAQEFFICCGFTSDNDPMKLDSTNADDGIPCESLP